MSKNRTRKSGVNAAKYNFCIYESGYLFRTEVLIVSNHTNQVLTAYNRSNFNQ